MNGLLQFLRSLGHARLIAMAGTLAACAALLFILVGATDPVAKSAPAPVPAASVNRPANSPADANAAAAAFRTEYETRLARNLEALLEQTVGPGKARVDVHADMDFDRVTTVSESYNPDGQVVRSTETVTQPRNGGDSGRAPAARLEERTQYEIPKTVRNQVRETGVVRRLSVAALVDGTYVRAADGTRRYEPRSPEELKQLTALLRTAVGYDERRGDTVEVVNLRFAATPEDGAGIAVSSSVALMGGAVVLAAALGLAAAFVVGWRRRTMRAAAAAQARRTEPATDTGAAESPAAGADLGKIGAIIDEHPEQAVSILRGWMYRSA